MKHYRCEIVKYPKQKEVGGFPAQSRSSVTTNKPNFLSQRIQTLHYNQMWKLVWLETMPFDFCGQQKLLRKQKKRTCDNLQQTKGGNCASLSGASQAHISGPAGLKKSWVTLKGRGEKKKNKTFGLVTCCKICSLKMDSVENKPREAYGKITALMFSENPLSRQWGIGSLCFFFLPLSAISLLPV